MISTCVAHVGGMEGVFCLHVLLSVIFFFVWAQKITFTTAKCSHWTGFDGEMLHGVAVVGRSCINHTRGQTFPNLATPTNTGALCNRQSCQNFGDSAAELAALVFSVTSCEKVAAHRLTHVYFSNWNLFCFLCDCCLFRRAH